MSFSKNSLIHPSATPRIRSNSIPFIKKYHLANGTEVTAISTIEQDLDNLTIDIASENHFMFDKKSTISNVRVFLCAQNSFKFTKPFIAMELEFSGDNNNNYDGVKWANLLAIKPSGEMSQLKNLGLGLGAGKRRINNIMTITSVIETVHLEMDKEFSPAAAIIPTIEFGESEISCIVNCNIKGCESSHIDFDAFDVKKEHIRFPSKIIESLDAPWRDLIALANAYDRLNQELLRQSAFSSKRYEALRQKLDNKR